ncbi:MAG: cysteine desulfurase [Deltaproteobacteria bacterium]|jgi:cysteine desulfurase|nr:cysteine desulfurase [Deltaproteobacteria bacterium]
MRKPIYMDNSATTRVSDAALDAMLPLFAESYGNPSALYDMGQDAFKALEDARASVAVSLGALKSEIFFTSGGTESDNWAIVSAAEAAGPKKRHMVCSAVEHNAVLKPLQWLESKGWEVTALAPDSTGAVSPEALDGAIRPDTALVTLMAANNVVGTLNDVKALAAVCRARRVLFHTDAVQAAGHVPVDVRDWDADMVSLSAHKFHGPKGAGALFSRIPRRPAPLVRGGGQEKGTRSGTENVPGAVGLAAALAEAARLMPRDSARLSAMRDRIIQGALGIPGVVLTGDPARRLPGHASFVVEGIRHSALLINMLNSLGVCASSGSACTAGSKEADHVLLALGYGWEPFASLRLSLSPYNTDEEVDFLLEALPGCIRELRGAWPTAFRASRARPARGGGEDASRGKLQSE